MYYSDDKYTLIPVPEEFEEVCSKYKQALCYNHKTNEFSIDESVMLEICKNNKNKVIEKKWQETVNLNFEYENNMYKCDEISLMRISTRLAHANAKTNLSSAEKTYFNINKQAVEFTDKASFEKFCKSIIEYRNMLDQKQEMLKGEVLNCTSVEEVEAIDITSGW